MEFTQRFLVSSAETKETKNSKETWPWVGLCMIKNVVGQGFVYFGFPNIQVHIKLLYNGLSVKINSGT